MDKDKLHTFLKTLGPGILFASTAIGVSHLVQSTRAGAEYGFLLIPFIIAANIFKYPFFEFGSRYANAAEESIIDGYRRVGKWMIWLYFIITIGSMFFVSAAVGAVTSGFLQNLFGISGWGIWPTIVLFAGCGAILMAGKFGLLDSLIKVISAVLLISTVLAFVLALFQGPVNELDHSTVSEGLWEPSSLLFIIALMGWMPTAVDLSAWNSLWTIERIKQTGYKPTMKQTLLDFNIGYWISAILSLCFVTLGAYSIFGSGIELPNKSGAFAHSVVNIVTKFIGDWSYVIIAAAGFSIMFGTCITVFDGYARAIGRTVSILSKGETLEEGHSTGAYNYALLTTIAGAFIIVFLLGSHLKSLVDLATTISFLIAPIIALVNYRLVTKFIPEAHRPSLIMKVLSWAGILFLSAFAIYFLIVKFWQ